MIDGNALAEYYAERFLNALIFLILLNILSCGLGWYCGDRWNLPSIRIEAAP